MVLKRKPLAALLIVFSSVHPSVSVPATAADQIEAGTDDLDRYGGWRGVRSEATGFFRVEKQDGRWWFITPEGHAFLSAGVNHVDYRKDYSNEFVDFVAAHLAQWRFNTIGWSQELMSRDPKSGAMVHSRGWGPKQYARANMPYAHLIRFTDIEWYVEEQFPDVFSEAFTQKCDRLAQEVCTELRDDPNLIGYFYADTPNWPRWAEEVGRQRLEAVARQYYQVIHDSIRRYDTNHLLLGDRYKGDRVITIGRDKVNGLPHEVLHAMKSTVDVLSVEYFDVLLMNRFVTPDQLRTDLARWYGVAGKPVLISDMLYLAPTELLKVGEKAPCYVPDQKARGEAYVRFAETAFTQPYVVGLHWCAFMENHSRKSGLKNYLDEPYEECVRQMQRFNRNRLYAAALHQ